MYAKKGANVKIVATLLAVVLIIGCTVGATLAWLKDNTDPVVNTFSTSNIGVELDESDDLDLKMIPGWSITKDPKAWITEGSEAAYLFVKVENSANFNTFMAEPVIADGWTELTSAAGTNYKVYYREVSTSMMGETNAFEILKDNKVTVLDSVTKEMMNGTDFTAPTLTFTAYASQLYKNNTETFTAEEAWTNLGA